MFYSYVYQSSSSNYEVQMCIPLRFHLRRFRQTFRDQVEHTTQYIATTI